MYSPSFFPLVVLEPSSSFSTVRAPLSLERAAAGSVVESPGGSGSTTRRVDPRAALLEATERNAREVREEQEAREAEARKAAAAQAAREEEAAKALAEAAAKAQAEAEAEAAAGEALMVTPLRTMAPGDVDPSPGGTSGSQPGLGGSGDDVIILEKAPEPTPPTRVAQGRQPEPAPAQSAEGEPAAGAEVAVRVPPSRRAGKAASEPQPAVGSSSSARDAEAASATSGWTPGGGTAVVNVAAQDVRTRLQSQAAALRQFTDEFLATRAAIRVSIPILFFLDLDFSRGGASAHPLGVVPEFRVGC